MNWFQRLALKAAGFPQSRTLSLTDPSGWPSWGEGTYAGKYVDDTTAMQVASVWSCNRVISETIASLPGAMFERDSSGNLNRIDHDLGEILTISPNADQTGPEFLESKLLNQGLNGNGYSLIERRGNGEVSSLTPVESTKMRPYRKENGPIRYKLTDRGKEEELPQEKVWHWKTFSRDGCVGLSPIGNARETMGLAMAQQEVAGKLFANGLHTSVFIHVPEWIKDEKREAVHAKIKKMYQGLQNAGDPFILEGGMTAEKGIMPFVDAQFVQLLGLGTDQICGVYRVPPHMIGKLDRATFSNIEQQSLEFVMYTILPYLRRIEASVSKWLLRPGERSKLVFRFNFEGLLRADSAARASLYSIMLQNGVLTRNEVRALENRNRLEVDGMDDPTVQQNMALIEQLSALIANKTTPLKVAA